MSEHASPLIEVAELESRLGSADFVVVDCRFVLTEPSAGREAWQAAHIPGAVYAHLDDDLARRAEPHEGRHPLPAPEAFAATLGRLGISADSTVVAYDDHGGAIAARLWWMLGWIGHPQRFLLNGGLQAWEAAELPLESGATTRESVSYEFRAANDAMVVSTEDIVGWNHKKRTDATAAVVLDARAPARFRGEQEPIDPVAGHVPGASNLPFNALLDEDQRYRTAEEIRQLISEEAEIPDDGEIIAMCGSGVTACHLLAGLAVAGRSGRLYVGSWSEWIRDPSRTVAIGD